MTDDVFTYFDPVQGRRRWRAPTMDPEPDRVGPDGFLAPEWAAWEVRRMDARQRGIRPDQPPPLPTERERRLAIYDELAEQAQATVQALARRQITVRAELREAEQPSKGVMGAAGQILVRRLPQERIARLRREIRDLEEAIVKAKRLEERIRGDRLDIAATGLPQSVAEGLEAAAAGVEVLDDGLVELGSPLVSGAAFVPPGEFGDLRGVRRIAYNPARFIESNEDGKPGRWVE